MKSKSLVLVASLIAILLIGGAVLVALNSTPSPTTPENNDQAEPSIPEPGIISNPDTTTTDEDDVVETTTPGTYISYTEANLGKDKNVIVFIAGWCPSCRELDRNLSASNVAKEIPSNLTILKANYDSEVSLKQRYGVTLQHTFVQVDSEGKMIHKWNGLYSQYTLNDLIKELK